VASEETGVPLALSTLAGKASARSLRHRTGYSGVIGAGAKAGLRFTSRTSG